MNQVQVIALLNSLEDLPSYYDHADVGAQLPLLVIHCDQPDNFAADNQVFCEKWNFRLDLYTVEKSLALETEVKNLLNSNGIAWTRSENYLTDESCWEVEFTFEVLGNEDPAPEGGEDDGNTSP